MCFNAPMSLAFTVAGLLIAYVRQKKYAFQAVFDVFFDGFYDILKDFFDVYDVVGCSLMPTLLF
jgi:hypothetical protein